VRHEQIKQIRFDQPGSNVIREIDGFEELEVDATALLDILFKVQPFLLCVEKLISPGP
jgi:hypothetical protein